MPNHGIDLPAYAAISADLAEGDRPVADILQRHGLTIEKWTEVTSYWSEQMTADARNGEARVTLEFSALFAAAQDAKKPMVELAVRDWALLRRDVDHLGPHKALAARGLSLADYSRLVRFWTRVIANDQAVRTAFEEAALGV